MSDIRQTIWDIERCLCYVPDACSDCSHHCDRESFPDCMEKLLDDAYQLLKAQQPRVMTLEEVRNNVEEPAWFESHGTFRGKKGFWILLGETNAGQFTKKIMCATGMTDTELGLSAYGEVWRCWTARPNEEIRSNTPWES